MSAVAETQNPIETLRAAMLWYHNAPHHVPSFEACGIKLCADARKALAEVEAVYTQVEALEAENERLREQVDALELRLALVSRPGGSCHD